MIDSVECCRQIQKDQGSKAATINFMKNAGMATINAADIFVDKTSGGLKVNVYKFILVSYPNTMYLVHIDQSVGCLCACVDHNCRIK